MRYDYMGMTSGGERVAGCIDAPSMESAIQQLRDEDITPHGVIRQADNGKKFKAQLEAIGATGGRATGTEGA